MKNHEFKKKVADVYNIANEVGAAFGINKCTPDGHLVGAFGQIAAKIAFGLTFGSGSEEHNCTWSDGSRTIEVQVRCTGAGTIALRREPIYLIAIEVSTNGMFTLLYSGPGAYVWERIKDQRNSQKYISGKALLELHNKLPIEEHLPIVDSSIFV